MPALLFRLRRSRPENTKHERPSHPATGHCGFDMLFRITLLGFFLLESHMLGPARHGHILELVYAITRFFAPHGNQESRGEGGPAYIMKSSTIILPIRKHGSATFNALRVIFQSTWGSKRKVWAVICPNASGVLSTVYPRLSSNATSTWLNFGS